MAAAQQGDGEVRRVLHIMRLPMGGLFRHVRDLVTGQQEAGIAAGVVCAEPPDDGISAKRLVEMERYCGLGLHVLPMSRLPGFGDIANAYELAALVRHLKPGILHGHGAKHFSILLFVVLCFMLVVVFNYIPPLSCVCPGNVGHCCSKNRLILITVLLAPLF